MNGEPFPLPFVIDILYKDKNGKSQTLSFNSKEWNMNLFNNKYWFVQNKDIHPKIAYEFNLRDNFRPYITSIIKYKFSKQDEIESAEILGEMYE